MKKLLLPLLLIAVSGLAAEPPVVKSKAAQELLKHPEFKKAMELVPEFTKAALKALDKFAPAPKKPIDPRKIARTRAAIGIKDKYDSKYEEVDEDPFEKDLRTAFKGMTREQVIALLGKPDEVNNFGAGVFNYRIEKEGKFTETKYHTLGFYFETQGTGAIFKFAALFQRTIK